MNKLLPLLAFVRPANKVIIFARILMSYLRIPIQMIKGLKPALPAIGGLFVSLSFVNFGKFRNYFDGLLSFSYHSANLI